MPIPETVEVLYLDAAFVQGDNELQLVFDLQQLEEFRVSNQ